MLTVQDQHISECMYARGSLQAVTGHLRCEAGFALIAPLAEIGGSSPCGSSCGNSSLEIDQPLHHLVNASVALHVAKTSAFFSMKEYFSHFWAL
ncbi:MAG: hypothetical protein FRX49_02111 [Trebouxia sp. A1-2]|nr:MAG: hypothetical protein FRX49_02111 [Trebouxia sp. A1-2]